MTETISALTHSRPVSFDTAMNACIAASDMGDVQLAHACLQKLIARPRPEDEEEDGIAICDGLAAIVRLINESVSRRQELVAFALRTLTQVIEHEREQDTL
jgi:hypothetical protein